jgi:hypothetical protein
MGHDRPNDPLVVERPQVLERSAAAGQDDHGRRVLRAAVGPALLAPAGQPVQGRDDARRRTLALDLARRQDEPGQRPAPRHHVADVVPDRAGGARRHADDGRPGGSGRLRAESNSPSAASRAFSASNLQGQVAEPGRLDRRHVQLVDALGSRRRRPAVDDDPQARPGSNGEASRSSRKKTQASWLRSSLSVK